MARLYSHHNQIDKKTNKRDWPTEIEQQLGPASLICCGANVDAIRHALVDANVARRVAVGICEAAKHYRGPRVW